MQLGRQREAGVPPSLACTCTVTLQALCPARPARPAYHHCPHLAPVTSVSRSAHPAMASSLKQGLAGALRHSFYVGIPFFRLLCSPPVKSPKRLPHFLPCSASLIDACQSFSPAFPIDTLDILHRNLTFDTDARRLILPFKYPLPAFLTRRKNGGTAHASSRDDIQASQASAGPKARGGT